MFVRCDIFGCVELHILCLQKILLSARKRKKGLKYQRVFQFGGGSKFGVYKIVNITSE